MQTRRDQMQAYRFVTRRIVSALLSGEPETSERPMRRYGLAVFGSAMIATIAFAGVGVVGFLFPSGARLADSAIVIERETGARYVYLDGRLHPVLNFASARLILGVEKPQIQRVSQRSLRGYPRGQAVGIANLPDPLPDRSAVAAVPWSACSARRSVGSADFATHLFLGTQPPGGENVTDKAIFIERRLEDSVQRHIVAGGRRYRISEASRAALGFAAARPIQVTEAIINGIPPGANLSIPSISDSGEPGPVIDGEPSEIGQLYVAADQHYILLRSGLAPVRTVMRDLLLGTDRTVTPISASAAARARSSSTFEPADFPATLPELAFATTEPGMVCLLTTPADAGNVNVVVHERRPDVEDPKAQARTGPDRVEFADAVHISGGQAAIVRLLPAPDDTTPNTTTYLVTDQGIRYALARENTAAVLSSLGYGGIEPMPLPTFLLSLLPLGPALDPKDAGKPVTTTQEE